MNIKQKITLIIGAMAIIASILFPTWSISAKGFELDNTRKFVYTNDISVLEKIIKENEEIGQVKINKIKVSLNYSRMIAEVAIILILTVVSIIMLNKRYYKFKN